VDTGWIKIHRKIWDSPVWQTKPFSQGQAWIDMLLMANHKENDLFVGNRIIKIVRGSFITSQRQLARRWGWERSKVRRFLKVLSKATQVTTHQATHKTTHVSIINYDSYQNMRPTLRPTLRPTKRPKDDPHLPTNKNVKNEKKKKTTGAYTKEFQTFWEAWPARNGKKQRKKDAFSSWQRKPVNISLDFLLTLIEKEKNTKSWKQGYIPDAATWLNGRGWENEIEEEKGPIFR